MHGITENDYVVTGYNTSQWHKLGDELSGEVSLEHIIMRLGWLVERRDLFTTGKLLGITEQGQPIYDEVKIEGRQALVRADTGDVLAPAVSSRYEIFQNEAGFEMLQTMMGLGAPFISAGSLFGGRKVFGCLSLEQAIDIAGVKVMPYLMALWGHDAMSGIGFFNCPIVPLCDNTVQFTIRGARSRWTTTHAGNASKRVAEAREALGLCEAYYANYAKQVERLCNTSIDGNRFATIRADIFPVVPDMTERERTSALANRVKVLQTHDQDSRFENWRGTGWGVLQAFNTWDQWNRHVRGGNGHGRALQQATRAINGQTEAFDNKVLAHLGFPS